jgi:threonine/homoserine/homoserine lactone efflux protein
MQTARHASGASAMAAETTRTVFTSASFARTAPNAVEPSFLRTILSVAGILVSGVVALLLSLLALLGLILSCPAAQQVTGVAGLKQSATPTRMGG